MNNNKNQKDDKITLAEYFEAAGCLVGASAGYALPLLMNPSLRQILVQSATMVVGGAVGLAIGNYTGHACDNKMVPLDNKPKEP